MRYEAAVAAKEVDGVSKTRLHQRDRRQRPDQIFRSRDMTARVEKSLPEKRNGKPKKDGRSYRLHGEQKEVTRAIADIVRSAPGTAYRILPFNHRVAT